MSGQGEPLSWDNVSFIEEQFSRFVEDPDSVGEDWREFFDSVSITSSVPTDAESAFLARQLHKLKQSQVSDLIQAYRRYGHLYADLDPLGLRKPPVRPIHLEQFGLEPTDLESVFPVGGRRASLAELIETARETYCRTIGVELGHIDEDAEARSWLEHRIERDRNRIRLDRNEQIELLTKLTDAEIFEQFLHAKFVGAKRFSLEGAESLIPLVERIIKDSAAHGVEEVVIGMAHRGRLNVLANVLDKPARDIFAEFRDRQPEELEDKLGRGDVKYHLGYSRDREIDGRPVHISLTFNPSHLEFVDPVVIGRVRAKQDRRGDRDRERVVPLLIHGDAAFPGQGIVAELFNMSELPGYRVGGTIHVVVNNQVGFTTSPEEGRSTHYPTDLAKMLQIPILHVNGEDPEAVAQVVRVAVEFRARFKKDVVIDLWCYRRHGHNEGDDPSFTQPHMVEVINKRPTVRDVFVGKLSQLGQVTEAQAHEIAVARRRLLEQQLAEASAEDLVSPFQPPSRTGELWKPYLGGLDGEVPEVATAIDDHRLSGLSERLTTLPPSVAPHRKVLRLLAERAAMGRGERPIDWGMAEALAFASLLTEGARVRLTGQDTVRGTFSHRHAAVVDQTSGQAYIPLQHLAPLQAPFEVRNSPLSEASCLGFEYGYSRDTPDGLVVWEAQFGDFANGGQVIIDQFIASCEDKWHRLSGLTLLLPHGLEGQGPEHSSARLERWLALAASDNLQICNLTTPAQLFHVLRRQVLRPYRKPLVIMSPKSLLRHPEAQSPHRALTREPFHRVIPDPAFEPGGPLDPAAVRRALLCSGKIYYALEAERRRRGRRDVAIIRVEQLYPTPLERIELALEPFDGLAELAWVQEEPRNQGAWMHMAEQIAEQPGFSLPLIPITRLRSASPATGSATVHRVEEERLLAAAYS